MMISIGLFRFDAAVADAGSAGIGGELERAGRGKQLVRASARSLP
jgi:hypothetical protein